jgi:hypothetical protein
MGRSKGDKKEAVVSEQIEQKVEPDQPAVAAAEVDPMGFLEDAAPFKIVPIPDWGGKDEDDPGNAQDYAVVDASDPRYATGGVILDGEGKPMLAPHVWEPGTLIDTGDIVKHDPSGEEWLVAYVDDDRLAMCGWPAGIAQLSDCTLVEKATAEARLKLLLELSAIGGDDHRSSHARRVLAAIGENTVLAAEHGIDLADLPRVPDAKDAPPMAVPATYSICQKCGDVTWPPRTKG